MFDFGIFHLICVMQVQHYPTHSVHFQSDSSSIPHIFIVCANYCPKERL